MASLDNFHTSNGSRRPFPTTVERNRWIQYGLQSSQSGSGWDLAGRVPIAPTQPYDPAMRTSAAPSPSLEQAYTPASNQGLFVPLTSRPQRRMGDTIEGIQLYDPCPQHFGRIPTGPCPFRSWWNRWAPSVGREVPLQTYSRFHPYLR